MPALSPALVHSHAIRRWTLTYVLYRIFRYTTLNHVRSTLMISRTRCCNFIIQSLLERFTEMALAQCTVYLMLWDSSSDNNNTSGLVRFNRTSRLLLGAVLLHVEVPEEDHHQHHQGQRHHGHLPRKAAVADPGDHHDALEWSVRWTDAT